MRITEFFIYLLICVCAVSAAKTAFEEITPATWDDIVRQQEEVIIVVYNEDKDLADHALAEADLALRDQDALFPEGTHFYKLNKTLYYEFCQEKKLFSSAQIVWVSKQDIWNTMKISARSSYLDISTWLKDNSVKSLPTAKNPKSIAREYTCGKETSFTVFLFDSDKGSKLDRQLTLLRVRLGDRDAKFVRINNDELKREAAEKYNRSEDEAFARIKFCLTGAESIVITEKDVEDLKELEQRIVDLTYPVVTRVSNGALRRAAAKYTYIMYVGIDENDLQFKSYIDMLSKITDAGILWDYSNLFAAFTSVGCSGHIFPTAVLVTNGTNPVPFDENLPFNQENVQAFVDSVKGGTYVPFKKNKKYVDTSGLIPELNYKSLQKVKDSGKLFVVVNFASKDRCDGYCADALQTLEKVKDYIDYYYKDTISFYKFDVEENFCEERELRVPDILVYNLPGQTEPVRYDSDKRTFKLLSKWLETIVKPAHDEL